MAWASCRYDDQDLSRPVGIPEMPDAQPVWELLLVVFTLLGEAPAIPGPGEATASAGRFCETAGSTAPVEHSVFRAQRRARPS